MVHRAFRLAYDGTDYHGFQRQPTVTTVEGELFAALGRLGVFDGEHRPSGYAAAGRTDRGVSALAQTVGLETPDWLTPRALNSELPASIRAWAMAKTDPSFHATHDAKRRTYTYYLLEETVELHRIQTALASLSGTHDFRALTPDDDNTTRTLQTALRVEAPFIVVTLEADGFPRQLVRRIVGLLTAIGRGERDDLEAVLAAETLSGPDGVQVAPPEPLVLCDVVYPGLSFDRDGEAATSAIEVFERNHQQLTTRARVARTIKRGVEPE
ncbi:tRNA pseudouridine(38-40) synthase TruA [Halocatena halophila]|uniref:tRNA pseudouridine(38-40) synthase TruA n=1 Tax=Halocatena halophila TaxID=2814576 RepID=UPI002ED647F2